MLSETVIISMVIISLLVVCSYYMWKSFVKYTKDNSEDVEKSVHELDRKH